MVPVARPRHPWRAPGRAAPGGPRLAPEADRAAPALAVLEGLVEVSPEGATRTHARDLLLALDTVARLVDSCPPPVAATTAAAFLPGVRSIDQLLDLLRSSLTPELWPDGAVCGFGAAAAALSKFCDTEETVGDAFAAVGFAAAALGEAVRALAPVLDAAVENARTALATETLLADAEDRHFERHRRILEVSIARQLDVLAKVRTVAQPVASGSFERAPPLELRVVGP